MQVLYHEDESTIEVNSSVEQFNDYFTVSVGGVRVPVEFDQIDYIDCGKVVSHPVIVDIDDQYGFLYPNGHRVISKEGALTGDDADDMEVAFHSDDIQVEYKSSADQFRGFMSGRLGGLDAPIEFDQINYIDCNTVNSDKVIVDVEADSDIVYPEGHMVVAKTKIKGTEGEEMSIGMSEDNVSVRAYSSLNQFSSFFSGRIGQDVLPIEFDQIDYIDCGKVVSHPVIVDNGDNIGYIFSDGIATYVTDTYPLFEHEEVVMKDLPAEFGEGQYQAYENSDVIVNYDDESFGVRDITSVRYGQDYFLADEILPAEDFE